VPSESDVYTIFRDPQRDEWTTKWLPILKAMPMEVLMERSGLSWRALYMIRAGRRPQLENVANLKWIAREQVK
jgi:hypothetical protein